jgi:hypothetical protein
MKTTTLAFQVEQLKLFHNKLAVLDSICVRGSPNRIAPGDRCLVHVRGPTVRELCEDILRSSSSSSNGAFAASVHMARWVPTTTTTAPIILGIRIDTTTASASSSSSSYTMERNRRGDRLIECKDGDIVRYAERVNGGHIEEEFFDADDDDDGMAHDGKSSDTTIIIGDKEERHRIFAEWLVQTYGIDALSSGSGVLDVAGGNGELTRALRTLGVPSVVLDPNPRIRDDDDNNDDNNNNNNNNNTLSTNIIRVLPYPLYGNGQDLTDRLDETGETVRTCSFVAGMHPDQATEAIVDTALRLGVAFAVVPCCVMPTLFPSRRQKIGGDPVRSHRAFCRYLLDKQEEQAVPLSPEEGTTEFKKKFEQTSLPFVGRNKVIFSRN